MNNEYELSLKKDTEIIPCFEDEAGDVPPMRNNFIPIKDIQQKTNKDIVGKLKYKNLQLKNNQTKLKMHNRI